MVAETEAFEATEASEAFDRMASASVASKAAGSLEKVAVEAAAAYSQLKLAVVAYNLEVLGIAGTVDIVVVAGNLVAAEQEAKVPAIPSGVAVEELDILPDQEGAVVLASPEIAAALVEAAEMQDRIEVVVAEARTAGHLTSWACLSSTENFYEVLSGLSMVDCSPFRPISSSEMWALVRDCEMNLTAQKVQTPSGALSRALPL